MARENFAPKEYFLTSSNHFRMRPGKSLSRSSSREALLQIRARFCPIVKRPNFFFGSCLNIHWSAQSCAFLASSSSHCISSIFSAPGCPGMSPCATAWRNLLCSSNISYLSVGPRPDFNRTPPLRHVWVLFPNKLQNKMTAARMLSALRVLSLRDAIIFP